jgi:Zn-dependent protease
VFGHGVYVIIGKCKVLPVGAFVEGELHLVINSIVSYPIQYLLFLALFILISFFFLKGIVEDHYPSLMTKGDSIIHKHFMKMRRLASDDTPFLLAMPPRATTLVW